MNDTIIHLEPSSRTVQEILKPLFDYYKTEAIALATLLYQRGASVEDIAEALNVTPQAVSKKFPKRELLNNAKRGGDTGE